MSSNRHPQPPSPSSRIPPYYIEPVPVIVADGRVIDGMLVDPNYPKQSVSSPTVDPRRPRKARPRKRPATGGEARPVRRPRLRAEGSGGSEAGGGKARRAEESGERASGGGLVEAAAGGAQPQPDQPTTPPTTYNASERMKALWDAGRYGPRKGQSGSCGDNGDDVGLLPEPGEAGVTLYTPGEECADNLTVEAIRLALVDNMGHPAYAAAQLGIHVSSLMLRVEKSEILRRALQQIEEARLDYAEDRLWTGVRRGSPWAVSMYLKCKGQHRGWAERRTPEKADPEKAGGTSWADLVRLVAASAAAGAARGARLPAGDGGAISVGEGSGQ
jgi:hypothetical protein